MRLAVIDCGTNTFNLLIIEQEETAKYTKLYQTRLSVKLGEDSINKGFIAEIPFQRGIEAIGIYKTQCNEFEVDTILAFATSAIRDASNGLEFVKEVAKRFNISIQVIDGKREAGLIYRGVKQAVCLNEDPSLIMDIGGGSNEFIIANKDQIFWKGSFNIGAARILEKFRFSDPATEKEIENVTKYLQDALNTLLLAVEEYKPRELIGSSGAYESFIEMIHGELHGEPLVTSKTEYFIDLKKYAEISEKVKRSSLIERKKMKGLVPMRLDMIVISCIMTDMIIKSCKLNKMRVSTYSLKEGALAEYLNN